MKTQFKSLLLFATDFGFIFNACKKGENAKQNDEVKKIIAFYEEIGRRHNEFLSRAFPVVKNKLSQKNLCESYTSYNNRGRNERNSY